MTAHICPECRNGKCRNCVGTAWDDDLDVAVDCECSHVTVVRTRPLTWPTALGVSALAFAPMYAVPLLGWFVGAWTLWVILAVGGFWMVAGWRENVRRSRVERVRAECNAATLAYLRHRPLSESIPVVLAAELDDDLRRLS